MRHVMALRVSKAVLVFAIALFYTILVLNNITDYGSNYEFVRHVLMMDSTFPGNHGMWRAVKSPLVHAVFYIGIIAWESVTMLLCWWGWVAEIVSRGQGAIRRCTERRRDCADDEPADVVGGIPRCRGRVVSDVAVAKVEWAGSGIPNVYSCRCGVFDCGATGANSGLVAYRQLFLTGFASPSNHFFESKSAFPVSKSTGKEMCSWTISHLPLSLRNTSVTRLTMSNPVPSF